MNSDDEIEINNVAYSHHIKAAALQSHHESHQTANFKTETQVNSNKGDPNPASFEI